ncbi:MAG: GUN4 domain-containing protein [Cyanobacteria bacterium Co-bin13]|nr:GUN4 domain-containing protein [Cyanobacteria bacterium Co-bin13]
MVSGAPLATNTLVKVVVQITDTDLDPKERAEEAQSIHGDLQRASEMQGVRMGFLERVTNEGTLQFGVRFTVGGEQVRGVLEELCDRIEDRPVEVLVTLYIDAMTLQVKTRDAEELAATIQAAELLVPPRRTFLAKAETYARSYGEFSPAEIANLEWMRQQLDIPGPEAERLVAKALGPYRTRQAKQQRYREVLVEELGRQFPPTDESRETLKEYAVNLKLPAADELAIFEEVVRKIQGDAEVKLSEKDSAAVTTLLQENTRLQAELQQQQAADRQATLENYRTEFAKTIETSLYPLQYDQGRLEQARLIWNIPAEEAKAIEQAETARRYGGIQSAVGADYSRLRELLWQGKWQEADRETERALLKAFNLVGQASNANQPLQDVRIVDHATLEQLPCVDLLTIDQLWRRYSDSRFGFRAQAQIFEEVAAQPQEFLRAVGWSEGLSLGNTSLIQSSQPYNRLQFSREAPEGHLPTWRWCCPSLEGGYVVDENIVDAFLSRLINACQILQSAASPNA